MAEGCRLGDPDSPTAKREPVTQQLENLPVLSQPTRSGMAGPPAGRAPRTNRAGSLRAGALCRASLKPTARTHQNHRSTAKVSTAS